MAEVILLIRNCYAPVKSDLTFWIDRLRRNWLEKLGRPIGSIAGRYMFVPSSPNFYPLLGPGKVVQKVEYVLL